MALASRYVEARNKTVAARLSMVGSLTILRLSPLCALLALTSAYCLLNKALEVKSASWGVEGEVWLRVLERCLHNFDKGTPYPILETALKAAKQQHKFYDKYARYICYDKSCSLYLFDTCTSVYNVEPETPSYARSANSSHLIAGPA